MNFTISDMLDLLINTYVAREFSLLGLVTCTIGRTKQIVTPPPPPFVKAYEQ